MELNKTQEYAAEIASRSEVQKVVRALRRLEKIWPHDQPIKVMSMGKNFHLFAIRAGGDMTIQKEGPMGWGIDPDLSIETFAIPHDGGDW